MMRESHPGLREKQMLEQIRKDFRNHPDNPFNQVHASYDASKEELAAMREEERAKKEKRLAGGSTS